MTASTALRMSHPCLLPIGRFLTALASAALILVGLGSPARAVPIDGNVTNQIWKLKYGVSDARYNEQAPYVGWLDKDDDGDGIKNRDERVAGTNPFLASSTIKVSSAVKVASNVNVSFPTVGKKRYQVESTATLLTPASWAVQGAAVTGDGNTMMVTVPYGANTFYRVKVDEVLDTDSDGVSDWAETQVTLNVNAAETVPDTNDLTYVNQQLALPNVVSIRAAEPFASEDGPTAGKFTITRTQNLVPITVSYGVAGTAVAATDYTAIATSVVFPARGFTSADIFVNPTTDPPMAPVVEGSKSVVATLNNPPNAMEFPFTLGSPSAATVIINDSTAAKGTGLLARYYDYALYQIAAYSYTKTYFGDPNAGNIVLTPVGALPLQVGQVIQVAFTSGNLNDPLYSGQNYTVSNVSGGVVTLSISGASLPANSSGNCEFALPPSALPGVINQVDPVVDNDWGTGIPAGLSNGDNFSVRWTGQVQPQFTEEYTFVVNADDGCKMWINGQLQEFKTLPSTNSGGSIYSYDSSTGNAVVDYRASLVKPNSFSVGEIVRVDPSSGNLSHGGGGTYTYDGVTGVLTVNYSGLTNIIPGGFAVGETIELDPTAGTLTTLANLPYIIASEPDNSTFTVYIAPGIFDSQLGPAAININDTRNAVVTAVTSTTFTVAFGTGKYNTGTGSINLEIANKPLKDFASMGNERYFRIPMLGGVRYDIQLDYYESTGSARCRLYWFSPGQPKQIIPQDRLYPAYDASVTPTVQTAPAAHVTPTDATALVGGAFSHPIAGSNGAAVTLSGNPGWLTYNVSTGTVGGTPPSGAAGDYQILITVTNAAGTSTSVLNLHVEKNIGTVVREKWTAGVASIADIPPTSGTPVTGNLTSLEAPTNNDENFGARIRGYISAPVTGNYYFWIAANNAAELWISNDDEPINAIKRAWVTTGNAMPQTWTGAVTQKSPWLALEGGKKYYFEVLHYAATGDDNLAVGWAKPGESTTAPSGVVPGYVLTPYVAPAPGTTPGTLYVATMLAQSGITTPTKGVGAATLRLSEDENVVTVSFDIPGFLTAPYNGLSGIMTDWHVHNDPYLTYASDIMYDPNVTHPPGDGPQPDGSHKWTIPPMVGSLTKAQVVELLKQGKAYINIHTGANLNGEIRGNFTLASGSRTFTPPPPPPSWADDHLTNAGAARFLQQATFGPNPADISALKGMASYEAWIDAQFALPIDPNLTQLSEVIRTEDASAQGGAFNNNLTFNAWWWKSMTAPDQLRQRIAFALSEIHVVSAQGPLENNALSLSYFYDKLAEGTGPTTGGAFGNFRDILEITTLTPGMGRYLDMLRNDKPDQTIGRIPNENYAREIKQLFSIGLFRMWPNGTLMLTSKDNVIDTYKQPEIVGLAHVFTGWDYGYDGAHKASFSGGANWTRQMRAVPARHYTGPKRILNNEVLPGLTTLGGQPLDPIATHTANNYNSAAYENLPTEELNAVHDQLFNHPNTGPFICRQLIQRLVTSSPSPDYVYRVVQKFNNNGSGVRGDMKAVIKAILLDYEARSNGVSAESLKPAYGKQREPIMRVAAATRAFRATPWTGTYSQTGTRTITITTPSGAHGLESGDSVFLNFTSGSPAPWIGTYSAGTPLNSTSYTVQAQGWTNGTYAQTAGQSTMTVTMGGHWLQNGHQAYFDFTAATTGTLPSDGVRIVSGSGTTDNPNAIVTNTFTIPAPDTNARSGTLMIPRFTPGSYTISASGLPPPNDRRVTMDTNFNHELLVGQQVQINFYEGNPLPVDRVATVEQIIDLNTWTFLAPSAGTNLSALQSLNQVYQFPLQPLPLTRSGSVGNRPSTFAVGNTTADLEQTPINSPTVFNFFLPDYKFPGTLQSQGITTPEFQLTAETTVIRQSNYLYNGVFGSNNVNGINSFNNGNHALVMDFSPWYGNATGASGVGLVLGPGPQTGQTWMSNANLSTLVEHMNLLLVSGQLSTEAKNRIIKFLYQTIGSVTTGSPCTINATAHGLNAGDTITISGITGGVYTGADTDGNGTFLISATGLTANSFRLRNTADSANLNCTTAGTLTAAHFSPIPYTNNTSDATMKRDRLRAIIHLILTSPDYTIQR